MKISCKIILSLALVIGSRLVATSQSSKDLPFQVINAKNAFNKDQKEINRFDLLKGNETISLKDGTLILLHHFGYPFEFKGDTTILLETINKDSIVKYRYCENAPTVHNLFSDQPFSIGYMPHAYFPTTVYPPDLMNEYTTQNVREDFCLQLKDTLSDYVSSLTYWYNEESYEYRLNNGLLKITAAALDSMAPDRKILEINVHSEEKTERRIYLYVVDSEYPSLFSCEVSSPSIAVMNGVFFEFLWQFEDAEKYYLKAIELSDDDLFKELYEHFVSRLITRSDN